mmetsp:Transcript_25708/g.59970  ORF Transcript_25708/g.59970 Transcript_25708/m.59970 type:complete len:225 (-) Transcript_25708:260-934(-)|eukprot:CAMPEP_0178408072 /NCGR_PEP_ID=MMETSP0689_2-20121128/19752_1 /TAXON_ID=160604 /ORGANISM="Amphidinium massartii, Strain CS-259" /LENGTH=224 /DNA_ID=CAMNT_0020029159 /DNA_START=63 /DNA_END=737 /DNA_ORIENTATION=+
MAAAFRAPRILCISGSNRVASVNTKLASVAATMLKTKGAETTQVNLVDHDLPLFSQDLEEKGAPPGVLHLKELFGNADALMVASPEYNGAITPALCNAITWMSRPVGNPKEPMYASFKGKVGVVISTSPGGLGGLRGLSPIRQLLTNLGTNVLPEQVAIGGAFKAFEGEGESLKLKSEDQEKLLDATMTRLFETARGVANQDALCKLVQDTIRSNEYGQVHIAE